MSVSLVGRVLDGIGLCLAQFCAAFRSWCLNQVRLVSGFMRWVFKVVHEWLEEVVDLLFRSRLWGENDASAGNSFARSNASLDDDGLVVRLRDPEWSVRDRCELVEVILFVAVLDVEEDLVAFGYNFTLLT